MKTSADGRWLPSIIDPGILEKEQKRWPGTGVGPVLFLKTVAPDPSSVKGNFGSCSAAQMSPTERPSTSFHHQSWRGVGGQEIRAETLTML